LNNYFEDKMSDILVDALPYIDMGYDEPGVREAVLQMVEEETRRYKPTKNYLENLSQLNLSLFEVFLTFLFINQFIDLFIYLFIHSFIRLILMIIN